MNIFDAITDGLHDHELEAIIKACKTRGKLIPLKVGDKVRATDNCAPKYMQGVLGEIIATTAKKSRGNPVYLVKVDKSEEYKLAGTKMGRYVNGEYHIVNINMPRDLIAKVDD